MKPTKKAISILSSIVLLSIITLPMLTLSVDAASVLENEDAAIARIGDSFEIIAKGRGGFNSNAIEEFQANYKIQMKFNFLIACKGERGVLFESLNGHLSINDTSYTFDNGMGIAGLPTKGKFNDTLVFGFKINLTDSDEQTSQLEFIGRVLRTQNHGPLLLMKGRVTFDGQILVFGVIGRIHRI